MNQKTGIITGVLILAVLAIGVFVYQDRGALQDEPSSAEQVFRAEPSERSFVVTMTDEGFSPTEFTIQRGTTVAWVNSSTKFRWPASNIHPTHELYPAFDPLEPVAPGEVWEFTFNEVGSWQFHDHLIPRFIGLITVTE